MIMDMECLAKKFPREGRNPEAAAAILLAAAVYIYDQYRDSFNKKKFREALNKLLDIYEVEEILKELQGQVAGCADAK